MKFRIPRESWRNVFFVILSLVVFFIGIWQGDMVRLCNLKSLWWEPFLCTTYGRFYDFTHLGIGIGYFLAIPALWFWFEGEENSWNKVLLTSSILLFFIALLLHDWESYLTLIPSWNVNEFWMFTGTRMTFGVGFAITEILVIAGYVINVLNLWFWE